MPDTAEYEIREKPMARRTDVPATSPLRAPQDCYRANALAR
jgi:hypothetical protein